MAQEATALAEHSRNQSPDLENFSCIEFRIHSMGTIYLSRLWQTPEGETCFLIKEGSAVLEHLSVGDDINARFLTGGSGGAPRQLKTHINGIRRETVGRFKGHHLIVLSLRDQHTTTH
ncbi:MAG: hypothetical protein ABIL58_26000 [Pseudomonadota bacterium]